MKVCDYILYIHDIHILKDVPRQDILENYLSFNKITQKYVIGIGCRSVVRQSASVKVLKNRASRINKIKK